MSFLPIFRELISLPHPLFQPGGCNFWKWENNYIEYLRSRWGKFFMPAPYMVLLDNNAWLKKIWIVAIANCLALCVVIARLN